MNREKIFEMIKPCLVDNQLTWDEFDEIFYMLSEKEKYLIADFLIDELKIFLVDEKETSTQEDFQFVDYVLGAVAPHLENLQLTWDEFDEIFSHLERRDQYKVTSILAASNIELVDEKIFVRTPAQIDSSTEKNFPTQPENIVPRKDYEIDATNTVLVRLAQNGDRQALHDLFVKNRRLVLKYASRYDRIFKHNFTLEDLEQVGTLGMLKAVERFDFRKGTQFSTYAVWWIKQAIARAIYDTGFTIRLPVHMFETINKVNKLDNEFSLYEENFSARIELIAQEMNISTDDVRELFLLRDTYLNMTSLDVPVGEESDSELKDFIEDSNAPSPYEMLEEKILTESIANALDTLTVREKQVLMLRFGFYDGREHTLEEIGRNWGLTRERIRQIEAKALNKLRHPSRSKKLKDFWD